MGRGVAASGALFRFRSGLRDFSSGAARQDPAVRAEKQSPAARSLSLGVQVKRSRRFRLVAIALLSTSLAAPLAARSAETTQLGAFRTISTKAPAWYTREVQQKVVAAGTKGYRIPDGFTMPVATSLAFLGIRPGQLIIIFNSGGFSLCTSNFVFSNGYSYAIGTAGHCGAVGDQVSMVTAPRVLVNIGNITKSTGDAGIGNDFALISIKPELNRIVSPSMAFWGGPTGPYSTTKVPLVLKHIGWGAVIGTGGTPRVGVGTYYSSTAYTFIGAITPGDSGSGATALNNQAVGNITHIFVGIGGGQGLTHTAAGTSIIRILQIAGLPLATCGPSPWPLYGCAHL
jgi:hypothetical protein